VVLQDRVAKGGREKCARPILGADEKLLEDPEGFYTPKKRPSGHDIGKSFATDNGGAIPSNLLQISNSESNGQYLRGCKAAGIKGHPARFPAKLPEFFIRFLTNPGDLVVDIFGGSNTTGQVAEAEEDAGLAASFQRNTSPPEPFDSWRFGRLSGNFQSVIDGKQLEFRGLSGQRMQEELFKE